MQKDKTICGGVLLFLSVLGISAILMGMGYLFSVLIESTTLGSVVGYVVLFYICVSFAVLGIACLVMVALASFIEIAESIF